MGKLAVIADSKAHVAGAVQQISAANIKRCVPSQGFHGNLKHGLEQGLMMREGGRAEIASVQHRIAHGIRPAVQRHRRAGMEIGGKLRGYGLDRAEIEEHGAAVKGS